MSNAENPAKTHLRRMAARQGFTVSKNRRRDPRAIDFDHWYVANAHTNYLEAELDGLDALEAFLTGDESTGCRAPTRPRLTDSRHQRKCPDGVGSTPGLADHGRVYMLSLSGSTVTRVAGYARVSTEDQADQRTIDAQDDFLRRYCDLHDLTLVKVYMDDGVSGTVPLEDRPDGRKLLEDAEAGQFDAVLV